MTVVFRERSCEESLDPPRLFSCDDSPDPVSNAYIFALFSCRKVREKNFTLERSDTL